MAQSLLQNIYFVAAVIVVFLVLSRLLLLRRRNQALSAFFRLRSTPRYNDPTRGSDYDSSVRLTPLPTAHRFDRRVHAADVDPHGRRLAPSGEDWDAKDLLPAYNALDRPPKYVGLGVSHGGPPPSSVDPLPNGDSGDHDRSGTTRTDLAPPPPIHVPAHS